MADGLNKLKELNELIEQVKKFKADIASGEVTLPSDLKPVEARPSKVNHSLTMGGINIPIKIENGKIICTAVELINEEKEEPPLEEVIQPKEEVVVMSADTLSVEQKKPWYKFWGKNGNKDTKLS